MGKVSYKMSKLMYDTIRYPLVWNPKLKKMVKKGKSLSKKEVLEHINNTFGLKEEVVEITLV